jgi:hypothetical protein
MKIVVETDLPKVLSITTTPSPTGNTVGLGHYVIDDKGSTYYIDRTGKAILIRKLTTDWNYPELLNGFVNYGSSYSHARWKVDDGVLYVEGVVKGGGRGKPLFKLPSSISSFIANRSIHVVDRNNNTTGRIDVKPDGTLVGVNISTSWVSTQLSRVLDI